MDIYLDNESKKSREKAIEVARHVLQTKVSALLVDNETDYSTNIKLILSEKRLKERAMDLAHASQLLVEPNPPHRKKLVFDYPEYQTCSTDFRPYNPKQSAIQYISKRAFDEKESNDGFGLDSCVQGLDWKMSPTLKKRFKNINSERIGYY